MTPAYKGQNKVSNIDLSFSVSDFRNRILTWYDKHARILPWRATQTDTRNAYYTWLSEIMLQQTTVQAVIPYFVSFIEKWPNIHDLARAKDEDVMKMWAGLGYYARARNLLKCARIISEYPYNGVFPKQIDELEKLPGIGPYTASAIASIAYDRPACVVDGNIERILSRIFAIQTPLPESKKQINDMASVLSEKRTDRPGDYAQALMDLGATICTPKSPKCMICPVKELCIACQNNIAHELPRKKPKAIKPLRHGRVFWIEREDGAVLFETRKPERMLGGMAGLPGSKWDHKQNPDQPDIADDIFSLVKDNITASHKEHIGHTFTHFHLKLQIVETNTPDKNYEVRPPYFWVLKDDLDTLGLPSLFKKVVAFIKATKG